MSRPISKSLLIHSVEHHPVASLDAYSKPTYGTSATLYNVRIETEKRIIQKAYGNVEEYKALMFWDAVKSTAATFAKLDKIVFSGVSYEISEIKSLYGDRGTVHHLEIALS